MDQGQPGAEGAADDFDRSIQALTDEQRAAEAVAARRQEHWLRQQSREEGSLAGLLVDLGERGAEVAVWTGSGRTLRGRIQTLGADFVGVRTPMGDLSLVPLAAVAVVRPEPGNDPAWGDRLVTVRAGLGGVLAERAARRARVSLHTTGTETVTGELTAVGRDVTTIRTDAGTDAYVPLAAVNDLRLEGGG